MPPATPRHNPFRTERTDALRYLLQDKTWVELLVRLEELRFRAAIVGKHGHGKTTLLSTLAPLLERQNWKIHHVRLSTSQRKPSALQWCELAKLGRNDLIFLDGAEQLNTLHWRLFLRRTAKAGGIIITTHHPGRLPTLIECKTSLTVLKKLVAELVPEYSFDDETLRVLFDRHDGNVREVLRELFDWYSMK